MNRSRWVRGLGIAVFLLLLGVAADTTVRMRRWVNRPFPGFLLYPAGLVFPIWTDPLSPLSAFGQVLHWRDIVRSYDGHPFTNASDLYGYVAGLPPGTLVNYTFADSSGVRIVAMPVKIFGKTHFWSLVWLFVLLPAIVMGLLALAAVFRPNWYGSIHLAGLIQPLGFWMLLAPQYMMDQGREVWFLAVTAAVPPGILWLTATFPNPWFSGRRLRAVGAASLLLAGVLFVALLSALHSGDQYLTVDTVAWGVGIASVVMAMLSGGLAYTRPRNDEVRRTTRHLMGGAMATFALGAIALVLGVLWDTRFFWGVPLACLPLAGAFLYAAFTAPRAGGS